MQRQEGQVLPLVAVVIVLAGVAMVAVVRFGGAVVDRGRASAAADAAALAGAAEGRESARALAAANGGRLVAYEQMGADVKVRVEVAGVGATARAQRAGSAGDGAQRPERRGVAPAMAAALARADQVLGGTVPVTRVHPPGLVVDVGDAAAQRLAARSGDTGLCAAGGNSYRVCWPG